jgi:hypothetical protein
MDCRIYNGLPRQDLEPLFSTLTHIKKDISYSIFLVKTFQSQNFARNSTGKTTKDTTLNISFVHVPEGCGRSSFSEV